MTSTSTNTEVAVQTVDDAIYEADSGLTVYPDYSGRGMYGARCFGVVGTQRGFMKFMIALAQTEPDLATDLAENLATDSMGHDVIFYFPGYSLDGESTTRGEDD